MTLKILEDLEFFSFLTSLIIKIDITNVNSPVIISKKNPKLSENVRRITNSKKAYIPKRTFDVLLNMVS